MPDISCRGRSTRHATKYVMRQTNCGKQKWQTSCKAKRNLECPRNRSMRSTLHSLTDMFFTIQTLLLLEALSYSAISPKTSFKYIYNCLQPSVHLYSRVNWSNVGWTELPRLRTDSRRTRTTILSIASPAG